MLPLTEPAPIDALSPVQIVAFEPASAVGNEFTVTVTLLDAIHPLPFVSVTVYVVVLVGLAVGLDAVALDNPVEGVHA